MNLHFLQRRAHYPHFPTLNAAVCTHYTSCASSSSPRDCCTASTTVSHRRHHGRRAHGVLATTAFALPHCSGTSTRPLGVMFNSASLSIGFHAAKLSPQSCTALAALALLRVLVTYPTWPFLKPRFLSFLGFSGGWMLPDASHMIAVVTEAT